MASTAEALLELLAIMLQVGGANGNNSRTATNCAYGSNGATEIVSFAIPFAPPVCTVVHCRVPMVIPGIDGATEWCQWSLPESPNVA